MSDTGTAAIKGLDTPLPERFADAYAELQAISAALKPAPNRVPDVDAIEPLVRRANALARYCQERIDAVRGLVEGDQQPD